MYYGAIHLCNEPIDVPISSLPDTCESYFMDGVFIDKTYTIRNSYTVAGGEQIHEFTKTGKPLFLYYGHQLGNPWSRVLDCLYDLNELCLENLRLEVVAVQEYRKKNNITGFVLNYVFEEGNAHLKHISLNLAVYVDIMKSVNPDLSYGLAIDARFLQTHTGCTEFNDTCLDFAILGEAFDFFVITLENFNKCSKHYKEGIVPINNDTGNTLTKIASVLNYANVPTDKIYYMFSLRPEVNNHIGPLCRPSYREKCTGKLDPHYANYCSDTSATYYEKGQFIKLHAAGFIGAYIDVDDCNKDCKCDVSFPAFYFIVIGYKNENLQTCALFDDN